MATNKLEELSFGKLAGMNLEQQKEFIKHYFVPLKSGNHAVYYDEKFRLMDNSLVKATYFNRMPKKVKDWYFEDYTEFRSIVYKLNQPLFIGDNKLNLCPRMKHQYKPYSEFSEDIKAKVQIMLKDLVFEVLCSSNQATYGFKLKWLANMIKGNKNNSCIYLKGRQGLGKSTLYVFIREHVIGELLSCETGSEPIKSRFNESLAGKLMVMFEELENFSTNEWLAISSKLKRYITSNRISIESKGVDSYETDNFNNYILLSNNDAIQDDDGRRYFIMDLATHRIGDRKFWSNIYDNCFNDEVGHAFYCYLMEVNTDKFDPQDFPVTQSKLDAHAKRLDNVILFLKENYVMKKRSIESSVDELFREYEAFCVVRKVKSKGKINFNAELKSYNINYVNKKIDGVKVNMFKVPHEDLLKIAETNHWIHQLDEETDDSEEEEQVKKVELSEADKLKKVIEKKDSIISEKDNQIEALKKQLEFLNSFKPPPTPPVESESDDEIEIITRPVSHRKVVEPKDRERSKPIIKFIQRLPAKDN